MKRKDDSLEWHDENELVRKLDVVEAVLNLADTIDDVVDVIMSVPNTDAPYIRVGIQTDWRLPQYSRYSADRKE